MVKCKKPFQRSGYHPAFGDIIHTGGIYGPCKDAWMVLGSKQSGTHVLVTVIWLTQLEPDGFDPPHKPYVTTCSIGERSAWHVAEQYAPE